MSVRDRILGATRRAETVTVPEWDGVTVTVVAMTAKERAEWGRAQRERGDVAGSEIGIAADLLARCVRDDQGEPVFTAADAEAIAAADGVAVERVLSVVYRLNGIGGDAAEKK